MADAKISSLAAAASVAATTMVPVVRSGSPVTEKATLEQIAGIAINNATAFKQIGANAVARPAVAKMREWRTPWDFGAVGDGTADDTAAWQRALATGKTVHDPEGGTFKITDTLSISTNGQRIVGAGPILTTFVPTGAVRLFSLTASGGGAGLGDFYVLGTGHTSGETIYVSGANRVQFRNLKGANCYNWAYVESCNNAKFVDCWNNSNRGSYSYRWYGSASKRSDGLTLDSCIFSADATDKPIGIDWDGNCHSLWLTNGGSLAGHSKALWVRNTSGGTVPAFLELNGFALEFCEYGALLDAGTSFNMQGLYSHGNTVGSGVTVGAAVSAYTTKISNSKLTGNARYGIEASSVVQAVGLDMSGNTLGETSGTVRTMTPGIGVDANAYWQMVSGNPVFAWASNAFHSFNRSTSTLGLTIDSTGVETNSATAKTINVPVTVTGTVTASGEVKGGSLAVDNTYRLRVSSGIAVMDYDVNDNRAFTRSSNTETLTINSVAVETATDTKMAINVPLQMPGYAIASLPSAAAFPGCTIRITDRNNRLASSDGTNWVWAGQAAATAVS